MYRSAALVLALVVAANAEGCPPTSITFNDYISRAGQTNGACTGNSDCGGGDGSSTGETCCVNFTFPYCGVPSSCNPYLKCVAPDQVVPTSAEPANPEDFAAAFSKIGGGGAHYDSCPPVGETWSDYQSKGGACSTNAGCDSEKAGSCCVKYTVSFCILVLCLMYNSRATSALDTAMVYVYVKLIGMYMLM